LNQFGGAERVLEVMHETFPDAPIFTSIYLPDKMPDVFKKMDIRTSFMQKLPFLKNHFKKYLLLYPLAFNSFNLSEYDLILSSSSAFAKGVRKRKNQCHICYCYTPMRFAWRYKDYIEREKFNFIIRMILPLFMSILRKWDIDSNRNVDHFITLSNFIAKRIKNIYNRTSVVIFPSINVKRFVPASNISDYFLVVSRLNAYKKIDVAIKAFNKLGFPLMIIGEGPYKEQLMKMAGKNIEFMGRISDNDLPKYYAECRAVIFPGEEDFGIVPVEAQAAGRPVIAYGSGGALETIIKDETGIYFDSIDEGSIMNAVNRFVSMKFDPKRIRDNALRFDDEIFKERLREFVNLKYAEFLNGKK
jgi:glycosyltransferase involved in cell wall biosynthesis